LKTLPKSYAFQNKHTYRNHFVTLNRKYRKKGVR
jgi:hypothetical protein